MLLTPSTPITCLLRFASGKVKRIQVHVEVMPIRDVLIGDYTNDTDFRVQFQSELNKMWQDKEQNMKKLSENEVA